MNKQEEVEKAFENFKQDNRENVELKINLLISKLIDIHNVDMPYTRKLTVLNEWVANFPDN